MRMVAVVTTPQDAQFAEEQLRIQKEWIFYAITSNEETIQSLIGKDVDPITLVIVSQNNLKLLAAEQQHYVYCMPANGVLYRLHDTTNLLPSFSSKSHEIIKCIEQDRGAWEKERKQEAVQEKKEDQEWDILDAEGDIPQPSKQGSQEWDDLSQNQDGITQPSGQPERVVAAEKAGQPKKTVANEQSALSADTEITKPSVHPQEVAKQANKSWTSLEWWLGK